MTTLTVNPLLYPQWSIRIIVYTQHTQQQTLKSTKRHLQPKIITIIDTISDLKILSAPTARLLLDWDFYALAAVFYIFLWGSLEHTMMSPLVHISPLVQSDADSELTTCAWMHREQSSDKSAAVNDTRTRQRRSAGSSILRSISIVEVSLQSIYTFEINTINYINRSTKF